MLPYQFINVNFNLIYVFEDINFLFNVRWLVLLKKVKIVFKMIVCYRKKCKFYT